MRISNILKKYYKSKLGLFFCPSPTILRPQWRPQLLIQLRFTSGTCSVVHNNCLCASAMLDVPQPPDTPSHATDMSDTDVYLSVALGVLLLEIV